MQMLKEARGFLERRLLGPEGQASAFSTGQEKGEGQKHRLQ